MVQSESIEAFYKRNEINNGIKPPSLEDLKKGQGHLNVFRREDFCKGRISPYNRRDFYKVSLVIGGGTLYYANKGIVVDRDALLFSNPTIPYSWEPSGPQSGYFCLFTENYITPGCAQSERCKPVPTRWHAGVLPGARAGGQNQRNL